MLGSDLVLRCYNWASLYFILSSLCIQRKSISVNYCLRKKERGCCINKGSFAIFIQHFSLSLLQRVNRVEGIPERDGPCWLLKLSWVRTQRVQMKGFLPWLVPLGSSGRYKRLYPTLAALVSPVQNILFPQRAYFNLCVPIAQQVVVQGRLSLKICLQGSKSVSVLSAGESTTALFVMVTQGRPFLLHGTKAKFLSQELKCSFHSIQRFLIIYI